MILYEAEQAIRGMLFLYHDVVHTKCHSVSEMEEERFVEYFWPTIYICATHFRVGLETPSVLTDMTTVW